MKEKYRTMYLVIIILVIWLSIISPANACSIEGENSSNDTKVDSSKERNKNTGKNDTKEVKDSSDSSNKKTSNEEQMFLLNEKVEKLVETSEQQQKMIEQQQKMIEQQQKMIEDLKGQLKVTISSSVLNTADKSPNTQAAKLNIENTVNTVNTVNTINTVNTVNTPLEVSNIETNVAKKDTNKPSSQSSDQKPDSIELAGGKVKIGTLFYGDYAFYAKTGFGPQFLTQINPPGPGNNGYNTFEITRAYINLFYSPNEAITFRLTPNIFRAFGTSSATKFGKNGALSANLDGEPTYRIKFAYIDFNTLFSGALKGDKLTIGSQRNPFVDWEEVLYGYRFVNLTPLNYVGFSAVHVGIAMHGPIKFHDKQYIDYDFGVYTNANFRQFEMTEKKQVMARVSFYPFGTAPTYKGAAYNFKGLGFTGFIDYGYTNVAPDTDGTRRLYRSAVLAHYTNENFGIAGEFDYGRNFFTTGNLFSGSGPAEEFGVATTPTPFANLDALAKSLLNNDRTRQEGFAFFGHVKIPKSPFEVFGMYQKFLPNTLVDNNPFDFQRIVAGISYRYNKNLRFALDSQNLSYTSDQNIFPFSQLVKFDPLLAGKNPNGISNPVPKDTRAIFFNVEFSF